MKYLEKGRRRNCWYLVKHVDRGYKLVTSPKKLLIGDGEGPKITTQALIETVLNLK